jgi:hypothetical protein
MEISSMIQSPHDLLQGSSKKRRISSKIRTTENVNSNSSEAFYITDLLETSQLRSRTTTPLIQPSMHPIPCRRGKWGSEEWAYAQRLVQDFQAGLLPLENGTSLRTLLATALNCDPMRISKKFVGRDCIGKQLYKRNVDAVVHLSATHTADAHQQHLLDLERVFLKKVKRQPGRQPRRMKPTVEEDSAPPLPISAVTASMLDPTNLCILSLISSEAAVVPEL